MKDGVRWAASGWLIVACGGAGAAAGGGTVPATSTSSATPSASESTASVTPSASSAPPAPPFVALRFTTEANPGAGEGSFGFKVLEVRPDGTILRDGAPYATLETDRVLGKDGKPFFAIANDGTLTSHTTDHDEYAKLGADGTLMGKGGLTFTVADDGTIKVTHGVHAQLAGKFDVVPPGAKREAALVIATTRPALALWSKAKSP